ncbi:Gfo/Idh/MocA family protein [Brevibacillus sp. B_LB10_24]|uniref:Gfo/Idh/MocA family protein n=1 Tax=Brevibacillus sp. B_LB10_24 TaxID=3380645 RepID=UPI0038B6D8F7
MNRKLELQIGMIGLDTSHCEAFTEIIQDHSHPYHVPGGRVTVAYPGGSPDFPLSATRVGTITHALQERFGVRIADSIAEVAEQADAILLTSVDGRIHLQQFAAVASFGKPVFIDKPLAVSFAEALRIFELARRHRVPVMSCSSLRFADGLVNAMQRQENGPITGAYCFGPMPLQPALPGLFWYGIHTVEMLFAVLGKDCVNATAVSSEEGDVITGLWADGRLGVIRGDRTWNKAFGAVIHHRDTVQFIDVQADVKPYYACLIEHVMRFFHSGQSPVDRMETLAIMRFIEAANESRQTGRTVML